MSDTEAKAADVAAPSETTTATTTTTTATPAPVPAAAPEATEHEGETPEPHHLSDKFPIDPEDTIFIGNVSYEVTEDDLKEIFTEEFGQVEVDIPEKPHREGHVPASRHAFVKFPKKIDFDAIKEKYDLKNIKEREIHIKKAKTAEELHSLSQRRFRHRNNGGRGGFGHRGGFAGRGRNGGRSGFQQRREKIPLDQMERSKDTLYVNNIPFDATREQLAEFFGVQVESVVLPMRRMRNHNTGRTYTSNKYNRGIAFVTFADIADDISKKVEEFNGKSIQDREIVVDIAVLRPESDEESGAQNDETAAAKDDEAKPEADAAED